MDLATLIVVGLVIVTALVFDFTNGFHDTANAMATSIATGALKPKTAVALAGVLNVVGAFLSTEVAKTISGGIINEQQVAISAEFILAGLIGAIVWNLITWLVGLPSSSSHALMGGLVGAVTVGAGVEGVNFLVVIQKIFIPALVSPLIAGLAAWLAVKLVFRIVRGVGDSQVAEGFRHGQTVTACLVALSHGTNDAQKTMGIITLALIAAGIQPSGSGPEFWVVVACGVTIALGTYMGGWRVIRTLGRGLTEITTPQGFAAEAASATTILASSHMGFALSTTQVCSGSIIGSGLGKRGSVVNWSIAGKMLIAWIVTFPAAGAVGAIACAVAKTGFSGTVLMVILAAAIAIGILARSRRDSVDATNVNDASGTRVAEPSIPEARIVDQGAVVGHA
ncbi:MAG: anion permease [Slackia sp.]|uniref:inorganic phosphate transporter n=1 Tax=uncultured Slackia sp. TaxID=665903 RepID=UPI0028038ADF|nr:anion permease [uncultured Slackia sp.]MDU6010871.1 anion permease [Slackia sp.]